MSHDLLSKIVEGYPQFNSKQLKPVCLRVLKTVFNKTPQSNFSTNNCYCIVRRRSKVWTYEFVPY